MKWDAKKFQICAHSKARKSDDVSHGLSLLLPVAGKYLSLKMRDSGKLSKQ